MFTLVRQAALEQLKPWEVGSLGTLGYDLLPTWLIMEVEFQVKSF